MGDGDSEVDGEDLVGSLAQRSWRFCWCWFRMGKRGVKELSKPIAQTRTSRRRSSRPRQSHPYA
jgi:hypothetical protein